MGDWLIGGNTQQFEMIGSDILARPLLVYPSLAANTKGVWVELTSATTFDVNAITVMVPYLYGSSDYLLDIGIGASGSEEVLIANLSISLGSSSYTDAPAFNPRIPIQIPTGTRISARCQATGTSASRMLRCGIILESGDWPSAGVIDTIGANIADSGGVEINPGASDNTKGSWTEITAATTNDIKGLFLCNGNRANTGRTDCSWQVDLGIGGAGSEEVILPNLAISTHAYPDSIYPSHTPIYGIGIPAGTRIAARAACTITDATDRLFDLILYGLV